jgi:hypothetical protein
MTCCLQRACSILETIEEHILPDGASLWVCRAAYDGAINELIGAQTRIKDRCRIDDTLADGEMRPG